MGPNRIFKILRKTTGAPRHHGMLSPVIKVPGKNILRKGDLTDRCWVEIRRRREKLSADFRKEEKRKKVPSSFRKPAAKKKTQNRTDGCMV